MEQTRQSTSASSGRQLDSLSERVPHTDPRPHLRCLTCTRVDSDCRDADADGDLRRHGECNRVIHDHPHRGQPVASW